jgi:cyclopropane fatty-acyl-phospholipid synthase-like methyltransferase
MQASRRARARMIDWRLNIDTVPSDHSARPATQNNDAVAYDVMDYPLLRRFIAKLMLQPSDVLVDIGCGKGRILCVAGRAGIARCIGIEIDPALAAMANQNARTLRGRRCPIEIQQQDATVADYDEGTVFCMFNPFGLRTMQAVLERLHESVQRRPRTIRIGYNHPAHEDVLEQSGWLECYARDKSVWFRHHSTFWRSV